MARLFGARIGGGSKIRGGRGAIGTATLDPSKAGNPDVVQQREAQALQGVMLSRQLRGNKSVGLRLPRR